MYANENLNKCLRGLSESCAGLIEERLHDGSYAVRAKAPVFENGQLVSCRITEAVDYCKIRHDAANNECWTAYAQFNSALNILKKDVKKLRGGAPHDKVPGDFARRQLALFVAQLAKDGGHKSPAALRATLSKFCKHLNGLDHVTYISPLYNVSGDFSTICLEPYLHIREATAEEYSRIVNLQDVPMDEIDPCRRRLKFVLSWSLPRLPTHIALSIATSAYSFALGVLKMFKDGYPQFGSVYEIESEHIDACGIGYPQSYYENPDAPIESQLTKNDARRLEVFYTTIVKNITTGEDNSSILNAIERFSMAYVHRAPNNRILDYVISLEALLAPSHKDLSSKLASRTATLYADTDVERVETQEFIKQAYNFRNGIVHESTPRSFKKGSSTLSIEEAESKLYDIGKKSILRFISLLGSYKNWEAVLCVLDLSTYEGNKMRDIKRVWEQDAL